MLNFRYQLFKHRCLGNVMKFLSPYLNGFLFSICHGYHALLVLGKDIPVTPDFHATTLKLLDHDKVWFNKNFCIIWLFI